MRSNTEADVEWPVLKPAHITAPRLQNWAHLPIRHGCTVERNSRVEVVDDMILHSHRADITQDGAEAACVAVAASLFSRMVRRPAEIVSDIDKR